MIYSFPQIKKKYPNFFYDTTLDFKNEVLLDDTLNLILDSVKNIFGDNLPQLNQLEKGFCNYKMYFPANSFSVYTYIEGTFDYRYPVVFSDEKLFISLDLFLGEKHTFYDSFPEYISFGHDTTYLPPTAFITLGRSTYPPPTN